MPSRKSKSTVENVGGFGTQRISVSVFNLLYIKGHEEVSLSKSVLVKGGVYKTLGDSHDF
jgi:hypothetical protein